jgi:hypothetical protein
MAPKTATGSAGSGSKTGSPAGSLEFYLNGTPAVESGRFVIPKPANIARLSLQLLENAMDDDRDKNLVEKLVDKINDVVEKIVTTPSDAAQHAMESDVKKMSGQPIASMPMAGDGFVSEPWSQEALRRRGVAGSAVRKNSVKQSATYALRNAKATH